MSRLTFATEGSSEEPTWTPDSKSVAFIQRGTPGNAVYQRRADGSTSASRLFSWDRPIEDLSLSPDGKQLLLEVTDSAGNRNVYVLTPGVDSVPRSLLSSPFRESNAAVSPDGRWLAHVSNESGRPEVYVRPFLDPSGSRVQVSNNGGSSPGWSRSGRELFYIRQRGPGAQSASMLAVDVRQGSEFSHGPPRVLFSHEVGPISYWSVSPDADRFVLIRGASRQPGGKSQVVIVENWIEELRAKQVRR